MSMLLEALRKSEAQRQLGETPTLQTPVDTGESSANGVPPWLPPASVVLAAVVMAWIGWAQYRPPDEHLLGALEQGSDQGESIARTAPPAGVDAAAALLPDDAAPDSPQSVIEPQLPQSSTASSESHADSRKQALGESFQSYAEEQQPAAPAAVKRRSVGSPPVEQDRPPSIAEPPENSVATTAAAAPTGAPETLSYWQIPQSLREGIPDLKITVLVYAQSPESRFVLLNGQRLREKDELENGLVLKEIQRDRAIFSYRSYVFYLKS